MPARTYHTTSVIAPDHSAVDHIWSGLGRIQNILAVRRQRKALSALEDHLLEDIGVTREQAETEAKRPLWDTPSHWVKR